MIKTKRRQIIAIVLLLIVTITNLQAKEKQQIKGKVVKVVDGDTIFLLLNKNEKIKIRLATIDAPEKKQPFGKKAKRHLSKLIGSKEVEAICKKKDRYKRLICIIKYQNNDINLSMIKAGLAWHYKKYQKEQTLVDQINYAIEEEKAKKQKIGLFIDTAPIEPWLWRKKKRLKAKQRRNADIALKQQLKIKNIQKDKHSYK